MHYFCNHPDPFKIFIAGYLGYNTFPLFNLGNLGDIHLISRDNITQYFAIHIQCNRWPTLAFQQGVKGFRLNTAFPDLI